jgi:hypothetical protein
MQTKQDDAPARAIRIDDGSGADLAVTILYDAMNPDDTIKLLPMEIKQCGAPFASASITAVNDKPVPAVPIDVASSRQENGCTVVRANADLKELGKHLAKGINRFTVKSGDASTEVLLEVEL